MKKQFKLINVLLSVLLALAFVSCKVELKSEESGKFEDSGSPAEVTNLKAAAKNAQILLTWTDATDEDIFGYEVTCSEVALINRSINAPSKNSMIISQGAGGCFVSNLKNGTEYTFTVTTLDTSGNKSSGVTVKATPVRGGTGEAMNISLTPSVPHQNGYTGDKSNTIVTITVNITSTGAVEKVVYKKDGSIKAKTLLADSKALSAIATEDNKVWKIYLSATDETANGTYTVAAIDKEGREEVEQIIIDQFDFTPPAKVKSVTGEYTSDSSIITLNWTNPADSDYDHVEISYTTNDGIRNSEPSQAIIVTKESNNKIFNEIDGTKAYYTYNFVTYDTLGNKSSKLSWKVSVGTTVANVPEDFVEVPGGTVTGAVADSAVFINGRTVVIPDLWVCDHEVTQKEYTTYCWYDHGSSHGEGDNRPIYYVNWYDAIVYCNLRTIAELSLGDCVYSINGEKDPRNWIGIVGNSETKYCGIYTRDSTWDAVAFDVTADGFRLPTEAEWEYIARCGSALSTDQYSGTNIEDELTDYAWYVDNSGHEIHEVKGKTPNALGLYDISGNIMEWCYDWYGDISPSTGSTGPSSGNSRCFRGGDWLNGAFHCSVWLRHDFEPHMHTGTVGFRVVRNAQ